MKEGCQDREVMMESQENPAYQARMDQLVMMVNQEDQDLKDQGVLLVIWLVSP